MWFGIVSLYAGYILEMGWGQVGSKWRFGGDMGIIAEVKRKWSCISSLSLCLHGRDKRKFTF